LDQADPLLVEAVLRGDDAAFGLLYDKYARLVRAVCYDEARNTADAQDMSQDVFMRAHDKLDRIKEREKFARWLVSIAKNVCREYRKKKARDRHILVGSDPPEANETQPEEHDDRLDGLQAALAKLPERQRLAIRAYYLQGEDPVQAGRVLNLSRSSFYRLLEKAREHLKTILDES
jgi:RNA polymerase sigma-70 factor (ECF subfamily)